MEICIICNRYCNTEISFVEKAIYNFILNSYDYLPLHQLKFINILKKSPELFCKNCIVIGLSYTDYDKDKISNKIKIFIRKYMI